MNLKLKSESEENNRTVSLEEIFPDLYNGSAIRGLRYREGLAQLQLAEKRVLAENRMTPEQAWQLSEEIKENWWKNT